MSIFILELVSVMLVCVLVTNIQGRKNGTSLEVCRNMSVGVDHRFTYDTKLNQFRYFNESKNSTYKIEALTVDGWQSGQPLMVRIYDWSNTHPFKGFLVKAFNGKNRTEEIGRLEVIRSWMHSSRVACGAPHYGISHNHNRTKSEVFFMWHPPATVANPRAVHSVVFRATIVQSMYLWFENIESQEYYQVGDVIASGSSKGINIGVMSIQLLLLTKYLLG